MRFGKAVKITTGTSSGPARSAATLAITQTAACTSISLGTKERTGYEPPSEKPSTVAWPQSKGSGTPRTSSRATKTSDQPETGSQSGECKEGKTQPLGVTG